MVVHKDYIMRLIEMLTAVLTRVLFNKEIGNYQRALIEIDDAWKSILGFDPDQVRAMNENEIISLLRSEKNQYAERCIITAELLNEEAEIKALQNDFDDGALAMLCKSFCLYVEAMIIDHRFAGKSYLNKTALIIQTLVEYEMPPLVKFYFFRYYELVKEYGKAEDTLYDLMDAEFPGILKEGISFYQRLLELTDAELAAGNLPRNEVQDGLERMGEKLNPC